MREKQYQELGFTDDFMFAKVMRNERLCRHLLEIILQVKIREIRYAEDQKTIDATYDGKSVRLDVYIEDDDRSVYDVEMQTTAPKNLAKRSRYYQGMIDLNLIEKGEDYNSLKKSYIIFICTKDIFGKGRHIYTFENRCSEDESLKLGDDAVKVFLNAGSEMDDVGEDLTNLLRYVADGTPTDDFTADLAKEVEKARANHEWEVEYMKFMVLKSELLAEGHAAGLAEGRAEATNIAVQNMAKYLIENGNAKDMDEALAVAQKALR